MPWQIEAAITDRTAAVACPIFDTPGTLSLPEVAEIAHARGVPVIVDAAAELPPRSNLRRFISEGADLVTFSGGKAIGGPQSSGILAGRADLIASIALQHQDMDVRGQTWNRRSLLGSGAIGGVPHQGLGRSLKVGREEIVGLITALERYVAGSDDDDALVWTGRLDIVAATLGEIDWCRRHAAMPRRARARARPDAWTRPSRTNGVRRGHRPARRQPAGRSHRVACGTRRVERQCDGAHGRRGRDRRPPPPRVADVGAGAKRLGLPG